MDTKGVIDVLADISTLLELKGENPFKARAYDKAVRILESAEYDVVAMAAAGSLGDIAGIGEALQRKITELATTGSLVYYDELRAEVPEGVQRMLAIPGLGPKKVKALWREMGLTTVDELEAACRDGSLSSLSGFGAKTQEKVLAGIAFLKEHGDRFLRAVVADDAAALAAHMAAAAAVVRCELGGSYRRCRETVKDLDLVVGSDDPEAVARHFKEFPGIAEVQVDGPTKIGVRLRSGLAVDLRIVADGDFPFMLHHFTGSKDHNAAMRRRAISMGLKMNEYGIFRDDGSRIDCDDEPAIFAALGLGYIPPELREDSGEIAAAAAGEIPALVAPGDLRGIVHCHSRWSDGAASIRDMAVRAGELGYAYLGISDHSRSAAYAGGLSVDDIRRQHDEIDALNADGQTIRVLKGIESDILGDGRLDYDDDVLETFDFVIASVHGQFNLSEEEQTARVIAALRHPRTHILGHPTGRLLLARDGYAINLPKVIDAAAELGKCIEINASPQRLDLDWAHVKRAKACGVPVSINPDAHSLAGIEAVAYGVQVARRGWLTAADVLNCLDADDFLRALGAGPVA